MMETGAITALIMAISLLQGASSQTVAPSQFLIPAEAVSVNGSSPTTNCSNITATSMVCNTPTSSVLFDGNIPTLTGLDGNQWANQLLVLNGTTTAPSIIANFSGGFGNLLRLEVVLFNCPQWGTGFRSIDLLAGSSFTSVSRVVALTRSPPVSCEFLVSTCFNFGLSGSSQTYLGLHFNPAENSTFVHLAEITFSSDRSSCPDDTVIIPTTALPTTEGPTTPASATTVLPVTMTTIIMTVALATLL